MSNLYAMRRANGDWFAIDVHRRIRVPIFHTSHDALMARLRNFGMLLFEPVALDARRLREISPAAGEGDVDFCVVKDPFANLSVGQLLEPAQLASLIGKHDAAQSGPRIGDSFPELPPNSLPQSEWWN